MHKIRNLALVTSLVILAGNSVTEALGQACSPVAGHDSTEYTKWEKQLNFHRNWRSSNFPKEAVKPFNYAGSMKVRIAPNGMITFLAVAQSSGDPVADFSCLESIASEAPFEAMPTKRHNYPDLEPGSSIANDFEPDRYQSIITFGGLDAQPKACPEAEVFYNKHPQLKNRCYLLHLIPLGINKHYPSLFSDNELTAENNLIALKGNVDPDEALKPFLDDWQAFITHTKTATKAQILKEAASIRQRHQRHLVVM
jgi:hypothetical protein